MELQLAVIQDYFTTGDVLSILDCFNEDANTQVKVIICMFSRIKNLESFDVIMRHLTAPAVQELVHKLGWLNILNPLKPSHDYILCQKYWDNRITTLKILELAGSESGDQLKEHPRTELHLINMYASIGRIVQEPSNKVLRVTYCEVGERPCPPEWNKRKQLLSFFLIGTNPIDNNVFKTIQMYKEVEAAGMLGMGPIDLQYMEYQASLKRKQSRKSTGRRVGSPQEMVDGVKRTSSSLPSLVGEVESLFSESTSAISRMSSKVDDDLSEVVVNDYGSRRMSMMSKNNS